MTRQHPAPASPPSMPIVAEAGDWSLIDGDDLNDVDTYIYVFDSGRLQFRFRADVDGTDVSTGWLSVDDLVTNAEAEGGTVVGLEIGGESYLTRPPHHRLPTERS